MEYDFRLDMTGKQPYSTIKSLVMIAILDYVHIRQVDGDHGPSRDDLRNALKAGQISFPNYDRWGPERLKFLEKCLEIHLLEKKRPDGYTSGHVHQHPNTIHTGDPRYPEHIDKENWIKNRKSTD